ncbi:ATP-dependent DNA helicase mph1 [Sphaceloma murrayae]|uniref:ATP-dependent DNA helicase mph1 n=1 Tax=Sphaceloma murrayae TaxID=2082308 RepID=A0A2K1QV88_9PEZI|nr:ATP-dependent DNA helicase mph1 [Sphaceloma murrayae]
MQFFSTIALVTSLLSATSVLAQNCYNSGAENQNLDTVFFHIGRACSGYDGNRGRFQGVFGAGETRVACVNVENGQHIDLVVQNRGSQGFDLRDEDCTNELIFLAGYCPSRGGEFSKAGWFFR